MSTPGVSTPGSGSTRGGPRRFIHPGRVGPPSRPDVPGGRHRCRRPQHACDPSPNQLPHDSRRKDHFPCRAVVRCGGSRPRHGLLNALVRAVGLPDQWMEAREVDPGRPAGVSTGGFPRAASRTRRARFRATGAPQAPSWVVRFLMPRPATESGSLFPGIGSRGAHLRRVEQRPFGCGWPPSARAIAAAEFLPGDPAVFAAQPSDDPCPNSLSPAQV